MRSGSVFTDPLTIVPLPNRRRRCHQCPQYPRTAATHAGCANGLAMTSGCEWHVRKWLQQTLKRRTR
jgi:hypothetical protein